MKRRNKEIYALLYKLTLSDKDIHRLELSYMMHIADALELTQEEVNEVTADPNAFDLKPPTPERERMTIIYYMLFAMQIDGEIHPSEEAMVHKAGLRLGFNEIMLNELINAMKHYLDKIIPDDVLVGIIKTHLN